MNRAIDDWLNLAEEEAENQGVKLEKNPFTSKATFLVEGEKVAGRVRTSIAQERDHSRIWLQYDHERSFMRNAHPNSRIVTVVLDLIDSNTFSFEKNNFIVVNAQDRERLPGGSEYPDKFYFYIDENGEYYYNYNNNRHYLPTNSWDAVFKK